MATERFCLDTTAGHVHDLKQHNNSPFLQDFFSISQQTKSPESCYTAGKGWHKVNADTKLNVAMALIQMIREA